jgi:hypothetical protein
VTATDRRTIRRVRRELNDDGIGHMHDVEIDDSKAVWYADPRHHRVESIVIAIERLDAASRETPHSVRGCYFREGESVCWCGRRSLLDGGMRDVNPQATAWPAFPRWIPNSWTCEKCLVVWVTPIGADERFCPRCDERRMRHGDVGQSYGEIPRQAEALS